MLWRRPGVITKLGILSLLSCIVTVQMQAGIDLSEFRPPFTNLAKRARISASSTCGEDQFGRPMTDLYCKLVGGPSYGRHSQTIEGQFCDYCNSNDPNKAHPIHNAIDGTERWWQSPPLSQGLEYNEVNITLDLGQLYHVAYVLIKFANSPRPALWVLERSVDYGRTFTPWQYFAHSKGECIDTFGKQPDSHILQDDDQICTTEYSKIVPLENGEIVVSLMNGRPGARNFAQAPVLQDFTKASNIRIRFLRTSTLLGHLISKAQRDPTVTRRYYYSIKDISIGGRPVCYLVPLVYSNLTAGNLNECASGFYRERRGQTAGRCVPCFCNGLSSECEEATGKCLNCQSNTAGDHCEHCREGYYGDASQRTCRVCPCPLKFAEGCREVTGGFQCICKPGYTGKRCEFCATGYYGDPQTYGGSCRPCNCDGSPGHCDPRTGICKNALEPRDTDMEEQCSECDNCAQTLLNDLEKLDDGLLRMKAQLNNDSTSSASQELLKKLEDAIASTKDLVIKFSSTVDSQKPKVNKLEKDASNLKDSMDDLKQEAEQKSKDALKAMNNVEDTHDKAKDLDNEARNLLKKIQDLLKQLNNADTSGGSLPSEDFGKLVKEAERMVKEMEKRTFKPQKDAAENELEEAQDLLDHIKNNVTQQYSANQKAADRIKGLLKGYEAKLKELEGLLTEANKLVIKANNQNSLNAKEMEDLLKRIKDLEKVRDKVADQIKMGKDQLKDTGDLLKMLNDSKKDYENLAAQLDGAKTDLTKKVNAMSKLADKEDLVKRAEEHAKNLQDLAKELEQAVQNSSGHSDVKLAIAAIDAYKGIVEAINAAEKAAREAKDASDNALKGVTKGNLPQRAKDLKDNANTLLTDAKDAVKDIKQVTADLADQKKRLNDAEKKRDALEAEHRSILDGLNNVPKDDISGIISAAKKAAASANDSAKDTIDKLNAIQADMAKINVAPTGTDSNIDGILNDVDKSVKSLNGTIPSLFDKISQLEDLSTQLAPSNNVSDNIKRIKELIDLARDAANRIVLPMKFDGNGHVEMHPPKDLEDLKAYTALSLTLQRPLNGRGDRSRRYSRQIDQDDGDLFVLYLGNRDTSSDYLGMAMKQDILYFVYKLDGKEYEIKVDTITKSEGDSAFFDKVEINRMYQDAEVILTKLFTSNTPDVPKPFTKQGELIKNLLDLNPDDLVFFVGGYPVDFTPPPSLQLPKYKGCIELSTFNERFISLYNFQKAVNINPQLPCKRYMQPQVNVYFEGSGFAKVELEKSHKITILNQFIETQSENGMLLYIGDEDSYYSISLEQGYVVLRGKDDNTILEPVRSTEKVVPLVGEVLVALLSTTKKITVKVAGKDVINANYSPGSYKHYYIGGLSKDLRERDNITTPPLKACVRSIKANNKHPHIEEKVGISKGCPQDFLASRKAEFSLDSSLETEPEGFDLAGDVTLSLGFRSSKEGGILLQNSQQNSEIELAMVDGYVVLSFQGGVWKSTKQYQDGEWHYLTVAKRGQRVELRIDEEDVGQRQASSPARIRSNNISVGKNTFKGCLSNLYMRRPKSLYHAENLSKFNVKGDVLLDVCNA